MTIREAAQTLSVSISPLRRGEGKENSPRIILLAVISKDFAKMYPERFRAVADVTRKTVAGVDLGVLASATLLTGEKIMGPKTYATAL